MARHTTKPVVDVAAAIPALAPLARETVRLHPRLGDAETDQSKIGGRFLWPADEVWPSCPEHGSPLVTILQLRTEDVPELRFRPNTDLFQLLWCPNSHEMLAPQFAPVARTFWRQRNQINEVLASPPVPELAEESYCPKPCVLHPEHVIEYPHAFELADFHPELWAAVESASQLAQAIPTIKEFAFDAAADLYQYWLSVAGGIKVAGYPHWCQDPAYPTCTCKQPMDYLLTIACEFDGGSWGRWLAEEDRSVWGGDPRERFKVQDASGLGSGLNMGAMNYYICRRCREWPVAADYQC